MVAYYSLKYHLVALNEIKGETLLCKKAFNLHKNIQPHHYFRDFESKLNVINDFKSNDQIRIKGKVYC